MLAPQVVLLHNRRLFRRATPRRLGRNNSAMAPTGQTDLHPRDPQMFEGARPPEPGRIGDYGMQA